MSDFIPAGEAEFLKFAEVFAGTAEKCAGALGIPAAAAANLTALLASYKTAYEACENPNAGRIDREDRKEKRAALSATIRKVKKAYIDADPLGAVTDEMRMQFGLPPVDHTRTKVPVPTELVPFTLENGGYLQIVVRHPARPERYSGAVAFYRVGGEPPASVTEFKSSKLLTRPYEVLTFEASALGQPLYIALRWQNEKGELGPPSPIQTRVIA
jgi:hypothetical protein